MSFLEAQSFTLRLLSPQLANLPCFESSVTPSTSAYSLQPTAMITIPLMQAPSMGWRESDPYSSKLEPRHHCTWAALCRSMYTRLQLLTSALWNILSHLSRILQSLEVTVSYVQASAERTGGGVARECARDPAGPSRSQLHDTEGAIVLL